MPCPQQTHQRYVNILLLYDISSFSDKVGCCFLSFSLHWFPKFKLLILLWLVSGCLLQCTQFRILVHQHSEILFHFVLEYLHWGSIIQVMCLQNQSYANSLHIVHRSPEAWIFNKFSVHSSGRYIFIFSLKYMCLRQNWQQIISFWVISVRISSTSMFKSWEWFGHDF